MAMGMKFSLMHSWCAGSIRIFYKVGVGTATHANGHGDEVFFDAQLVCW